MLRLPLTALSILCLILLSFWSIWRTNLAPLFTPQPLATPTVRVITTATVTTPPVMASTVAVVPTPLSTLPALQMATGIAALPPFRLHLPANWRYVNLTHDHLREQVQQLALSSALGEIALRLPALVPDGSAVVVAWSPEEAPQVGLIAYALPRSTLTLEQYVAESSNQLRAQPTVILHRAEVNDMIHAEVPVALLHYTQLGVNTGTATGDREGYQLVIFDRVAEKLLLLTWISSDNAPAVAADQLLPASLQSIIDTLER